MIEVVETDDPAASASVPEVAARAALGAEVLRVPDAALARRAKRVATVIDAIRAAR